MSHNAYSVREELANAASHGLGVLASLAAGVVLITLASTHADAWHVVGAAVYVAALVTLFTASTLYHAIPYPTAKQRLKVFDHCSIYLLIAGTYTPFTLTALRGGWGWSLFGVIWGLAIAGIVFKLFATGRFRRLSTGIYVAMGWMVLVAAVPLVRSVPGVVLAWLLIGGLTYTAGTLFYHNRHVPYSHAIWHLFVLVGASCHFVAVYQQLLMN